MCEYLFPTVKGDFADVELSAKIADHVPGLDLPEGIDDQVFGES